MSGFEMIKQSIELFQSDANSFTNLFDDLTGSSSSAWLTTFTIYGILSPAIFALISLYMTILGKYSGGPFTFLLLYLGISWALFFFAGEQVGVDTNFFKMAEFGLWGNVGALFVPFVGMFFLDKSI